MQILTLFSEIYETDISKTYIKVYIDILDDYSYEQIEFGYQRLINDRPYKSYPTPGEFIRYMKDDRDNSGVQATLAYEKVMRMCKIATGSDTVAFDDPAISRTVNVLGGWPQLHSIIVFEKEKLSILFRQFDQTYQRFHKARVDKPCTLLGTDGKDSSVRRLPEHDEVVKLIIAPESKLPDDSHDVEF
jgi:hypothetical protein